MTPQQRGRTLGLVALTVGGVRGYNLLIALAQLAVTAGWYVQ